jgi:hypothetical protein
LAGKSENNPRGTITYGQNLDVKELNLPESPSSVGLCPRVRNRQKHRGRAAV